MANQLPRVAYFCMEYGLDNSFKQWAGGLGILAGDTLKGAHDNGLPMVGVGLNWKHGYTDQRIGRDGRPYDSFHDYDYPWLKDTGVTVTVQVRGNDVRAKVWLCDHFGNAPLFLLDTDLADNPESWITGQLYGGFGDQRVAQEMILGIGGVRALQALGVEVDIYHFNEGHAVLAGLELIRQKMAAGASFEDAWQATRRQVVFTTHTPVPEGNEWHPIERLLYMGANVGLTYEQLARIGGSPFNMTVAGLRLAKCANGVAQLHGETANRMWRSVEGRCEIRAITNGVHLPTWVDPRMAGPFNSLEEMWEAHMAIKRETIDFIAERTGVRLDPENLLIGFSRRAAPYKRSDLIFRYEERVRGLLEQGKIQIVFSGKAHPHDDTGKQIVHNLVTMAEQYPRSVVFIENYDMEIAAALTRGCDVWLNNPRRPQEACGTSGMKAAMNGVLNASILDGWWPEAAQHGVNGWVIGDEVVPESVAEQDERDALALYRVLLDEIVPTYYENRQKWLEMMKASIETTRERFSVDRMLREYWERLYTA
ncbi:starch phosphorylase [Symbiobacterium terraclitae]|uniref:glycogen phosphorylase n=1 Tax=Symbiobacterium terraclitae TaxID=557451 RepID=A0ABS4JM60_9FIRM|nr:alpha-glucan family phosphorylase [Symbiobacterium terraclitae]MBP2016637.1 starch phosphorylase [Symbiobacterium terraclitae]